MRGGKRFGAGRPAKDELAKRRSIRLTDADYLKFKQLGGAAWLREKLKEQKIII